MLRKILLFLDTHILKIGIAFLLFFIPLYPKLPLLDIKNTWVYIRLEDVFVLTLAAIWFIQLIRKKVSLVTPLTAPIVLYWLIGGISLLFSLIFLSSKLANFFPNVAILHYLRRIEYILPFFIAFSTIKSLKDVKHYLIIITLTLLGVVFYGFGQRYLGFPAFLTMNEEFSKGIPLYLPPTARIASTFAGHYDLAAFLVLMIVFLGSLIFGLKKLVFKIGLFILVFLAFILLLFTASRISFAVYLLTVSFMLYLQNKKWLIVPVVVLSIILMSYASGVSERFSKTLRIERVVYSTKTGQPIAVLEEPSPVVPIPVPDENLPLGSGFLTVPVLEKAPEATTVAMIKRTIISSLKTASSSSEIATISGDFLIRRTIVYDISFTTRFQGEWPRAWEAFKRNPILGSGYSSISLATDGDYLRALGETGILGLFTLMTIFFTGVLVIRRTLKTRIPQLERCVLIGAGAGLLSLLINATLIDAFEASKVAFPFWMILGITVGMASLKTRKESILAEAKEVLKLPVTAFILFFFIGAILFYEILNNYFVGDDFTWLKWAATSMKKDILNFFLWTEGFFYRPLAKTYFTLAYQFLGLKPAVYHLLELFIHFGSVVAVYFISLALTRKKLVAFLAGLFFLLHPANAESILWISSISGSLAVFFYLWSFLFYIWRYNCDQLDESKAKYSQLSWQKWGFFILSVLSFTLGIFSHEVALTLPILLFLVDSIFFQKPKRWLLRFATLLPYFLILDVYLWLRVGAGAHGLTGDYGYNPQNFVFNTVGNLWGYLGILIAGERFIPVYEIVRSALRSQKFLAIGGLVVFALLLLLILTIKKARIRKWLENAPRSRIPLCGENSKILIFAFFWFILTLIPFWGLGNIAERYVYLASFAFVLTLAFLVTFIWEKLKQKRSELLAFGLLIVIIGTITGVYWREMKDAEKDWKESGDTANKILLAISSNYASFSPKTTIYFVDLPIRHQRAWIFPVGLEDGLWFIYRDQSLKIEKVDSAEKALDLAEANPPAHVFVFENNDLKEAMRKEVVKEE